MEYMIYLRKLSIKDAEEMFNNWASDSEVCKFMTWNAHKSIDETKNILKQWEKDYKNNSAIRFGIVLKKTNELIGSIDVVSYINGIPQIGYCLSKKYWNKGYMSETLNQFCNYLFKIKKFPKIIIRCDENNIASNKVIIKNGFRFIKKEKYFYKIKNKESILNCFEKVYGFEEPKIYAMNLFNNPFEMIINRTKTIEMRLNDEKRKTLKEYDYIEFTNKTNDKKCLVFIQKLHYFLSFESLYKKFNKEVLGYLPNEVANPNDMLKYYSKENIKKYGVLGIEITLICAWQG